MTHVSVYVCVDAPQLSCGFLDLGSSNFYKVLGSSQFKFRLTDSAILASSVNMMIDSVREPIKSCAKHELLLKHLASIIPWSSGWVGHLEYMFLV